MATCLDYSLNYIHLYPKTEQELRTKLYTKKYPEPDINWTIDFLKTKGYINDLQFTQLYIQSEVVKKGKLPALVKAKLIHKGVDKTIINQVMEEKENDMDDGVLKRIRKEIEKYKSKGLDGYEIMLKISQKGYRISEIRKAIKEGEE